MNNSSSQIMVKYVLRDAFGNEREVCEEITNSATVLRDKLAEVKAAGGRIKGTHLVTAM
jgi:hypothetical protein